MAPIEEEVFHQAVKDRTALITGSTSERMTAATNMQKAVIMLDGTPHQQKEAGLYFSVVFADSAALAKMQQDMVIGPSTSPVSHCKVASWEEDEDSCQAQKHLRCKTCGVWKSDGAICRLSSETFINKYVEASVSGVDRAKKVSAALEFGRITVKELVSLERERMDKWVPTDDKPSAWVSTWRLMSSIVTIVFLAQAVIAFLD